MTKNQKKIFENILLKKEEYLNIRIEDKYYSDSWEQSMQISKDIENISEDISALKKIIYCGEWSNRMYKIIKEEIICRKIIHRTSK